MPQRELKWWLDELLLEEPCESCLERGWHWVSFSGDLHYQRESCLVPGVIEWGDPRFDFESP